AYAAGAVSRAATTAVAAERPVIASRLLRFMTLLMSAAMSGTGSGRIRYLAGCVDGMARQPRFGGRSAAPRGRALAFRAGTPPWCPPGRTEWLSADGPMPDFIAGRFRVCCGQQHPMW